jgi:hypothetical protein
VLQSTAAKTTQSRPWLGDGPASAALVSSAELIP